MGTFHPINDPDEVLRLTGQPPDNEAEVIVEMVMQRARNIWNKPDLKSPTVVYELRGGVAGTAHYSPKKGINQIDLNVGFLWDKHREDMLTNTVPHEVAHIICDQLYPGSKPHGHEWRYVMYRLGYEPTRCHQYEVTPARVVKRPFIYACKCREAGVTKLLHKRMQNGQRRYCTRCRANLRYVGEVSDG